MRNSLDITEYVRSARFREAMNMPIECVEEYTLYSHGEYNVNYEFYHPVDGRHLLLRVNAGSQMHLIHQIEYEANALGMIGVSGRTPEIVYVDGSEEAPGDGVLVETFLPGDACMDYSIAEHRRQAAKCLADIHSVRVDDSEVIWCNPESVPSDNRRMIAPTTSLAAILEECEHMFSKYYNSDIPEEASKQRIRKLLDNAWKLVDREQSTPYRCCINTDCNSTNFLVDEDGTMRLVDWEKPLYGDPAQDAGFYVAPTTTFWRSDVILTQAEIDDFIDEYIEAVDGRYDITGLRERILSYIPITCLRGITWVSQAYVEYRGEGNKILTTEETRNKIDSYLEDSFIEYIESIIERANKE